MNRSDFEKDVHSFIPDLSADQIAELWSMAEEHAQDAIDDFPDEDDLRSEGEENYEIPGFLYNELDACIRSFEGDDIAEAKRLFSRALKEIPGAPRWLD